MTETGSTDTVQLRVNADGSMYVASWSQWEPTCELRIVRPRTTTTKADRLQQLFRRHGYSTAGHVCGGEEEWRDVPLELI